MPNEQNDHDTFAKMGKTYQEKVVQALLQDYLFAEQMADVIDPKFFELKYLQEIVGQFYKHKQEFKSYPSPDLLEIMITKTDDADAMMTVQVKEYLGRIKSNPLNGDTGYIQASSLEFCKKQILKEAFIKGIDMMESGNYDSIQSTIKEALGKGSTRDLGHNYLEGFSRRAEKSVRKPISTGWPNIDKEFNGGWERGTLSTFIAPTGAGKSMFLVNCAASAIAQGLNALYITLEMADWKIGIRADSYFTGIPINDIQSQQERVEQEVRAKAQGELVIKEWATKTATVQTIRAYIQRLHATKNFMPDVVVVDYADLLRGARGGGDKRFELESIYEDLRALAQEFNVVLITADQTNRSGLDMEIVTIGQIGEAYAKATVCDVIMTVSRRPEDKQNNSGRLFIAKSRLGRDGMVYPFLLNTATVKVTILNQGEDPIALFLENHKNLQQTIGDRFQKLVKNSDK